MKSGDVRREREGRRREKSRKVFTDGNSSRKRREKLFSYLSFFPSSAVGLHRFVSFHPQNILKYENNNNIKRLLNDRKS
jgi:hypothetical protein